jgi:hypothetical protein
MPCSCVFVPSRTTTARTSGILSGAAAVASLCSNAFGMPQIIIIIIGKEHKCVAIVVCIVKSLQKFDKLSKLTFLLALLENAQRLAWQVGHGFESSALRKNSRRLGSVMTLAMKHTTRILCTPSH